VGKPWDKDLERVGNSGVSNNGLIVVAHIDPSRNVMQTRESLDILIVNDQTPFIDHYATLVLIEATRHSTRICLPTHQSTDILIRILPACPNPILGSQAHQDKLRCMLLWGEIGPFEHPGSERCAP
jgi:hypothetical protein